MRAVRYIITVCILVTVVLAVPMDPRIKFAFPKTDFKRATVSFAGISSGGPAKDGIPSIDSPKFVGVKDERLHALGEKEPVIQLVLDGQAVAYPIRVLMYHEIVNDVVAGVPVAVTYCPLCNSSMVFDRRVKGRVLSFGVSGLLRKSNLIMYDRQTESFWQQFVGEGIVGKYAGISLKWLPSNLVSFAEFKKHHPAGKVLIPNSYTARKYGTNPYRGYDLIPVPNFYQGGYNGPLPAKARLIVVGDEAWPEVMIRDQGTVYHGAYEFRYVPGQNSALDTYDIQKGRDVGTIYVRKRVGPSEYEDVIFHRSFAFAFKWFYPKGKIHGDLGRYAKKPVLRR